MAAGKELALGLAVAHAAWLWFWLCGSLALAPARGPQSRAAALLDAVLASVTGIAITGFVTFALGLAHALYPVAALLAVPALGVALALRGDSPLRAEFWTLRLTQLRRAAAPGALIAYMLALFLSAPALIPDNGSDATAFYLPQAIEYARSHELFVDTWFRYPWYPNNWVLILTWPHVLDAERSVQFMNWLVGALALLGVYGLVAYADTPGEAERERRVSWLGLAAVASLAAQPIFVRFLNVGMLDVPSGTFFLTCTVACVVAVRERSARTLPALVLCGGFLVGMKISFIALVPLLAGLVLISVGAGRPSRRVAALALAALVAGSAPWYVRAFVLSGDPIEPVLNLRIQGTDPKISQDDLRGQLGDLAGDDRPIALLTLPWSMFADPGGRQSRDVGVTLLALTLPLPAVYLAWAFLARRRRPRPLLIAALAIVYAIAYWNLTSHLERYALMYMPLLAAFAGMLGVTLGRRRTWAPYAAFAALLVLAIPSPAAAQFYTQLWDYGYKSVGVYYTDRTLWLEYRAPAYWQLQDVAHLLHRAHAADRPVYMLELGGDTYFAQQFGVVLMGDAFGPGRFRDLGRAVQYGVLGPWLAKFHVSSLIAAQSMLEDDPSFVGLEDSLRGLGWRKYRYAKTEWVVFVAPDLPALHIGEGQPPGAPAEGRPTPETSPDPFDRRPKN